MRKGESREFGVCGKRYKEKNLTTGTAKLMRIRGTHVARAQGQHWCKGKHNLIGSQEAWGVAVWKGSWEGLAPLEKCGSWGGPASELYFACFP